MRSRMGDSVVLAKRLTLKGSSDSIKIGTKVSNIRPIAGDHEIDCKINGRGILLPLRSLADCEVTRAL